MDRATSPDERRAGLARMKQTLIAARMGLDDLRAALEVTRGRLASETTALETMRRRGGLAAGIADQETVALAEKYEAHHAERVAVLARKLDAQVAELAIAERDVAEMTAELNRARVGTGTGSGSSSLDAAADADIDDGTTIRQEIDALGRAASRSAREADAERLLAELKRRMGK